MGKKTAFKSFVSKEDLETAAAYISSPNEFVRAMDVAINGKLRHLITYTPSKNGHALRILHKRFAAFLQARHCQAISSYAYAKNKNIIMCVEQHLYSTVFLKTDIHAYFDSLAFERMLSKFREMNFAKKDLKNIELVVKACFYQNSLPIGFVSSPVISDLFLTTLDHEYEKIEGIVYTRYADDFIISTSGDDAMKRLSDFLLKLERDLKDLGLVLNGKKTYTRSLLAPGDAIHVLGLNLVRTEVAANRITVSDRYIRATCKDVCAWIEGVDRGPAPEKTFAKLYGKISFIQQCSSSSFEKLKKMTKIKCGYSGSWNDQDLFAIGM